MMKIKQSTVSIKHIPQRTCVACRKVRPKRELIRLVRVSGGGVEIDSTGKMSGRGAYLCPAQDCWETVINSGRLEYALRTNITQDIREQLVICLKKVQ